MHTRKKVLAITGSTRKQSVNLNLINAINKLFEEQIQLELFEGIANIPHFNPDLDTDNPPKEVIHFRSRIRETHGVLICTPEYAMGVPGTLKNAIDWTVSSMEFSGKPVALVTASLSGEKGHASLMETLRIIESMIAPGCDLVIPFVKTKVKDSEITDKETLGQVSQLMISFINKMNEVTVEARLQ
jgi:chromate reductase, NAD(P)H dehydrogenase (quinone)